MNFPCFCLFFETQSLFYPVVCTNLCLNIFTKTLSMECPSNVTMAVELCVMIIHLKNLAEALEENKAYSFRVSSEFEETGKERK